MKSHSPTPDPTSPRKGRISNPGRKIPSKDDPILRKLRTIATSDPILGKENNDSAKEEKHSTPKSPTKQDNLFKKAILKKHAIDAITNVTGLDSFPDIIPEPSSPGPGGKMNLKSPGSGGSSDSSESRSARVALGLEPSPSISAWAGIRKAHQITSSLKQHKDAGHHNAEAQKAVAEAEVSESSDEDEEEDCKQEPPARPPRTSGHVERMRYGDEVRNRNQSTAAGCIKMERFILKISDLVSLKRLFDSLDIDCDGRVSTEDVCHQRRELKKQRDKVKKDQIERSHGGDDFSEGTIMMMLSTEETVTFEDLLLVTYPQMTPQDLELCTDYLAQLKKPEKVTTVKTKKSFNQKFWDEFIEADRQFHMVADREGVISEKDFNTICMRMMSEDVSKPRYLDIANKRTKVIHRQEFVMWWLDLYQEHSFSWEDIEEDAEKYWRKMDAKRKEHQGLYMQSMK